MPKAGKTRKKIPRPEFFITTVPVIRPCRACGVWLAAGIAEGEHVRADLTALDQIQAMLATIASVRLYALTRTGLVELDRYRLLDPAFTGRFPEHRCGTVWESRLTGGGGLAKPDKTDTPPF